MKVCVVGAGAIGGLFASWLATRLAPAELALSALARGSTLQALRTGGFAYSSATTPDVPARSIPVQASDDADDLGPQDLVIVALKGPALAAVAPAVNQLCGPDTPVLVAMNGVPWWYFDGSTGACAGLRLESVDPGGAIRAQIPTRSVIGCVVHLSSTSPAPGAVHHVNGDGLIIGEPDGAPSERLAQLGDLLSRAGFTVTHSHCIQRDIWFKLWGNMTMNPVSALTGATCDRVLDDPLVRAFIARVMTEAQAIGTRFGVEIDQTPEQRHAITRKLGAFKTSMLQDLEAGRALEIDALVGAVREIGQHLQLQTPNIDTLLGLVRLMARSRGLYPA
ncbi:MAG TPA: 2-dehydropantoate 2-reductase [Rubrivivax sp.]